MTVSDVGDYLIGSAWGLASALGVVDVAHSMGKALPFVGKVVPNLDKYISFALFTVFLPLLLYGQMCIRDRHDAVQSGSGHSRAASERHRHVAAALGFTLERRKPSVPHSGR